MNEIEKLEARIEATDTAIATVRMAMGVDRKLSHDKHTNGLFTKALDELTSIRSQLSNLKVRVETLNK